MPGSIDKKRKAEVWDVMQLLFSEFNDHQIHCVVRFAARLDEERLELAVGRLIEAFPLLRNRFVEKSGGPYWEDGGFTAKDMVFLLKADCAEDEMERVVCSKTDAFAGPQLLVYLIRGPRADSLCVIINHMLCDGAGFKELLYLLSLTYTRLKTEPGYRPPRQDGDRSARQILGEFGFRGKLKILSQRYDISRHDDSIVFGLDGDRRAPFIVTHTIAQNRFLAAKAFAGQYGATVNDLLLAAYLRALRRILPGRTAAIQCVLDLRKFLPRQKKTRLCNLTSNLVCDIGPDIGESFADTLIKVKRAMDAEKKQAACLHLIMLLETVFRVFPYGIAKYLILREYRNPPLAMSNIGVIDHRRLSFDGTEIKSAFVTGSVKYQPFFQLALSTFHNEVTLSVAFHGTRADKEKIEGFLRSVDAALP